LVNADFFEITNTRINEAIDKGVKDLGDNIKDVAFTNQLRSSAGVFSVFKAHHNTKAISALLIDKDGNLVDFNTFKKEALKISNKHLKSWLRTEYNTAIRRATVGANFQQYIKDIDLYPNLRWTPSRSESPRNSHEKLYGLVLPVRDPFWVDNFPGNLWNCKCGFEQTTAKAGKAPKSIYKIPNGLDGNPAITGDIIAKSHPYFKGVIETDSKQLLKTLSKAKDKELTIWNKSNINQLVGKTIESKMTQTKSITLLRGDVKNLFKKITDPFLKSYVTVLEKDLVNWEYLGYSNVIEGKHQNIKIFTYYKTKYGKETLYINVKIDDSLRERPYAIKLTIDNAKLIKKDIPSEYKKKN
jgi:hypothetical protein